MSSSRADSPITPVEPGAADSTTILSPDKGRVEKPRKKSEEEFVTDSGQAVRFVEARVPTARKKKKVIRATVIGGFVLFVLALVGLIVLAVNLLFGPKPVDPNADKNPGVDPTKNPIVETSPNLLGVPIGNETAVVIDGTEFSRRWYTKVSEVVSKHVMMAPTTDFLIVTWTDLTVKTFPAAKAEKIGEGKKAELERFLGNVTPVNKASPVPSVQFAVDARANQIVLISGRILEEDELAKLEAEIRKRVDTRFDAVVIDHHDAGLQKLAKDNLGVYISLPLEQFETWYDAWKAGDNPKPE